MAAGLAGSETTLLSHRGGIVLRTPSGEKLRIAKLRLFIGAARLAAELNGVADAPHIRDKITEMIRLERAVWACGVTASLESHPREPGYQVPDPVLTNAGWRYTYAEPVSRPWATRIWSGMISITSGWRVET